LQDDRLTFHCDECGQWQQWQRPSLLSVELASTLAPDWSDTKPVERVGSRNRQGLGGRRTIRRSKNRSNHYKMQGSRSANRLREFAFKGLAVGLALGAVLVALVHNLPTVSTQIIATRANQQLAASAIDRGLVATAFASRSLIVPVFSTTVYEGGVYDQFSSAIQAVSDIKKSGIDAAIVKTGKAVLILLGATVNARRDSQFRGLLDRQQVHYFLRVYKTHQWSVPVPTLAATKVAEIEKLLLNDETLLQGVIVAHAHIAAPYLPALDQQGQKAMQLVQSDLLKNLGREGERLIALTEAVHLAEKDLLQGTGASEKRLMNDLARATSLYTQIGQGNS